MKVVPLEPGFGAEIRGLDLIDVVSSDSAYRAGKALIAELIADATKETCTYLHCWRKGDVVLWDNRASMHRGRPWSEA